MKKINNFLEKYIEKILLVFLYIQPVLDIVTAVSINKFNINLTISSIVRLLFLVFSVIYLLFIDNTKNKKRNITFLIMFLIYLILFVVTTIIYKDINAINYEIKNTLNTFYFPIILITFIDIFEQYNLKFKLKNIIYIYLIYIVFVIIPNLTHTGFLSYSHSKLGSVGWFLSANAVGNILSFLLPFMIIYLIKNKSNIFIKILIIISVLYVFASMGTKVPILSLVICFIGTFLYFVIKWIKEKKVKSIIISMVSLLIIVISSIMIIPKTTFYKNIEIHKNYLGFNSYFDVLTNYELIDHFIFSQRLTFLNNTHNNYKDSNLPEKVLGIGYIENYGTDEVSIKTIEIDYFEIFYRNGIIGVVLYLYIIFPISMEIIKKIKGYSLIKTEYKISIILILLLALFSGHILVTPAVSIFVSLVLAIIIQGGFYEKIN